VRSPFQSIRNVSATHLVAALLLVVSPVAASPPEAGSQAVRGATAAKPVPRLADGKPDMGGLWVKSAAGNMSRDSTNDICGRLPDLRGCSYKVEGGGPLPLTEWGKQWMSVLDKDVYDPLAHCYPIGYTHGTVSFRSPTQIVHTPREVAFLIEHGQEFRLTYMDGRPYPKFEEAHITWNGHSRGHWEGDTLVIDTRGPWWGVPLMTLDTEGHPFSDVMQLVERLRRVDYETIEYEMTVNDPKSYTRPWKNTGIWKLMPPEKYEFIGQYCVENNVELEEGLIPTVMPAEYRRFLQHQVGPLPVSVDDQVR
jgi:hypothetical protein